MIQKNINQICKIKNSKNVNIQIIQQNQTNFIPKIESTNEEDNQDQCPQFLTNCISKSYYSYQIVIVFSVLTLFQIILTGTLLHTLRKHNSIIKNRLSGVLIFQILADFIQIIQLPFLLYQFKLDSLEEHIIEGLRILNYTLVFIAQYLFALKHASQIDLSIKQYSIPINEQKVRIVLYMLLITIVVIFFMTIFINVVVRGNDVYQKTVLVIQILEVFMSLLMLIFIIYALLPQCKQNSKFVQKCTKNNILYTVSFISLIFSNLLAVFLDAKYGTITFVQQQYDINPNILTFLDQILVDFIDFTVFTIVTIIKLSEVKQNVKYIKIQNRKSEKYSQTSNEMTYEIGKRVSDKVTSNQVQQVSNGEMNIVSGFQTGLQVESQSGINVQDIEDSMVFMTQLSDS